MATVKKFNIKNTTALKGYDERDIGAEAYNVDVGFAEDGSIITDSTQAASTTKNAAEVFQEVTTNAQTMAEEVSKEFEELNTSMTQALKTKAPMQHDSETTEYGVASTEKYGHIKIGEGLSVNKGVITASYDTVGAAKKDHSSSTSEYGIGTAANYGHVKIADDLTATASDQALSTVGAQTIKTALDETTTKVNSLKIVNYDKEDITFVSYNLTTPDGTATIEEACKELIPHLKETNQVGSFLGFIELDSSTQCPVVGAAGNALFEIEDNSNFMCCCQGNFYTFGYIAGIWFFNKVATNTDHDFTITTDWLDNTTYGDYANYPYYQIISTDIYSDVSYPVCLILAGTPSAFMTEIERDCKAYISDEMQFSKTGIVVLATDKTTTNLTLRVKGV